MRRRALTPGAAGGRAAGRGARAVAAPTIASTRASGGRRAAAVDARVIPVVSAAGGVAVAALAVAVVTAPPVVLAEEGRPADRALGRREVSAEAALRDRHEVVPDLRRERPARDRDAVDAAHLAQRIRVADPDRRGEAGREA